MNSMKDALDGVTDPGLRRQLASLGEKIVACSHQDLGPETAPQQTAKVIQLPLWPEPVRGIPNSVLRGALFAAIQSKDRHYMKRELLAAQEGIEIFYTGMQLDQFDLDVWEQSLHLARKHPLGTYCHFTANSFLQALGRSTGGAQHTLLKTSLDRQIACAIEIRHTRTKLSYTGSLIVDALRDEDDPRDRYILKLNPKMAALYDSGWTAIDWEQRKELKGKPLAQWLHGYYSTHASPYPVYVEYLQRISGSGNGNLNSFRQKLIIAHKWVQSVGGIRDFDINKDGLVSVNNVPSDSQKKHLRKSKSRKE